MLKQLENASAKFHISRLEALRIHIRQSMEELFAKQQGTLAEGLGEIYRSGYYHTAYELQRGFGVGWDIDGIDQKQLTKVLAKPWAADGRNFSERIWGNKTALINELHNELSRSIMLGERPQKAIEAIARKLKTSRNNAGRLVMTESSYFSSAAQGDCYNELGVEEYQIVATLDDRTSEICQEMDLKVFPMKDYQAGVTAPPFHVRCRSTTVPYFADNFGVIGERAARGEDGKTYYVPADMSYGEWKESFAGGGDKSGLQKIDKGGTIKENVINEVPDVHYVGKINRGIFSCVTPDIITDEVIITDERIAHIKERHPGDFERYVEYLTRIVETPDKILGANKPNTGVILKEIEDSGEKFKVILRVKVENDPADYRNSVLSFWKIGDTTWKKDMKNKKILYSRE